MARYSGAKWDPIPENATQAAITPTQFIVHSVIASWTADRIGDYWRESTNLESHFGLGYAGDLNQYIDTGVRADANAGANGRAVSIETASNLQGTDPWTPAQLERLVGLGVWLNRTHGIPARLPETATSPGMGYHRLHPSWSTSGTACPGDARVSQFLNYVLPEINRRLDPLPEPPEEEVPTLVSTPSSVQAVDVPLDPSEWVSLALDVDGGGFVAGPTGALTLALTLYFDVATPVDTKIQGKFYLVDADGSRSDYLPIDHRGGGGHQFVHNVPVPVGKKLWFEVRAVPADGAAVTQLLHRDLKGHYFA